MADIDFFELTHARRGHAINADAVAHWRLEEGLVFAIADGRGDEESGPVASALALESFGEEVCQAPADWPVLRRLQRGVQAANLALYQKRVTVPELTEMRATLTAAALVGGSLLAAHVGNGRLWLKRGHALTQLTKDHTWGWDPATSGVLAPTPPRGAPRRYAIPRCLGHELIISIDLLSMKLREGDLIVQCTRGVHSALAEEDILELLEAHPPEAACRALVRSADEADAEEDLAAQVAAVSALAAEAPRPWWRALFSSVLTPGP